MTTPQQPHAVTPVRKTDLVTLILDQLRELIAAEGLRPGDRLPPERLLASKLKVSRPSLRTALERLAQHGALRRVQGGGTYLESNFATVLAEERHSHFEEDSTFAEVVEARRYLEPVLVQLAAERIGESQIESLRSEVAEAGHCLNDVYAWHQHDLRFHTQLARLSGNSILSATLEALFPQVLASWHARPEHFDLGGFHADHEAIVEALASKDIAGAAARMRKHLISFEASLLAGNAARRSGLEATSDEWDDRDPVASVPGQKENQ